MPKNRKDGFLIPLDEIRAARKRVFGDVIRTPLVRLHLPDAPAEIFLKLETWQPVGSFKLRGAGNAMRAIDWRQLARGVWTASAGNMGRAVAWYARRLGLPCKVVMPEDAPTVKLAAVRELGAHVLPVPFADYQAIQRTRRCAQVDGLLIHPFADPAVMAGNGVIGLEILEDLPDVDAIVVPYGGGGLSCGIASAVRALEPGVEVYASEVETGAPLAASLAAGRPVEVDYRPSFVTGMGAPFVFPEMWPRASRLLDGSLVVSLQQVADAIRLLIEWNHVVAEGAGATPVAAALSGQAGGGRIVCVVSGSNIGLHELTCILQGGVP